MSANTPDAQAGLPAADPQSPLTEADRKTAISSQHDVTEPTQGVRLHTLCDEFERALVSGERPQLEAYLGRVDAQQQGPLLKELVEIELWHRQKRGESPQLAEYQTRFPQHREQLQAIGQRSTAIDVDSTFAGYQIQAKLGEGGMGSVWKALHLRLEKLVALKVLPEHLTRDPALVARFDREMKAVGKLEHPHIIRAMDAGEVEGTHYLVMEYVEGSDLSKLVRTKGPRPIVEACELVRQAALGLAHAHANGLVHRDIKPSNLLLTKQGKLKILDLGLARLQETGGDQPSDNPGLTLTGMGMCMGTPDYMAPEQWENTHTADARADLYALGCTLFFLLTGKAPYDDKEHGSLPKKMIAHIHEPIPDLKSRRPEVPDAVNDLYQRLMVKDPAQRLSSAAELAQALAPIVRELRSNAGKQPAAKPSGVNAAAALAPTVTAARPADQPAPPSNIGSTQATSPPSAGDPELQAMLASLAAEPSVPVAVSRRAGKATKPAGPPAKRIDRTQVAWWAGGLLLVALMVLWSAGILFKVETEHGTLVINVTGDNFATTVQGQTVTIRNTETEETYTIRLDELRTTQPDLETGTYEFVLETDSGLKTRSNRFEITGEGENVVEVWWEAEGDGTTTTVANTAGWHGWPADAPPPAIAPFSADEAAAHQQAWADYLGVPVEYENSIGMKFRLIPPGEFLMGSPPEEIEAALRDARTQEWRSQVQSEGPQHKVILTQPVYVGVTEVTQLQFESVMRTNPSEFSANRTDIEAAISLDTSDHPVEMVSWNDAAEFCEKLSQQEELAPCYVRSEESVTPLEGTGYRLPTEAEWEFACRAGTTTRFWCGQQDEDLVRCAWFTSNSGGHTHPVAELRANPFGLVDMHGNVWEWVQDSWVPAAYSSITRDAVNPSVPFLDGSLRVVRGGDRWSIPSICRSAVRSYHDRESRKEYVGFRVALPVETVRERIPTSDNPTPPALLDSVESLDPHRQVAEMVISRGGSVVIVAPHQKFVSTLHELPSTRFAIKDISLSESTTLEDHDLRCLGDIEWLGSLVLARTSVSDAGMALILELGEVQLIDLAFCANISDEGVGVLSELRYLDYVALSETDITDAAAAALARMPQLRVLALNRTGITDGALSHVGRLPNLKTLDLTGATNVTSSGLAALQSIPTLQQLRLHSAIPVDDDAVPVLEKFAALRWLDVRGTRISREGALRLREALPSCSVLHDSLASNETDIRAAQWVMDNGGFVSPVLDSSFTSIPNWPFAVSHVLFDHGPPSQPVDGSEHLDGLRSIEVLKWRGLRNADNELIRISEMSSLRCLGLSSSDIRPEVILNVGNLTQLDALVLDDCQRLTDESFSSLPRYSYLKYLCLNHSPVGDSGLSAIAKTTSLQSLELVGCLNITDEGVSSLVELPRLIELNVTNTSLSDAAIPHLQQLHSLRFLFAHGTQITPEGAARLQAALPRCVVFHESLESIPWRLVDASTQVGEATTVTATSGWYGWPADAPPPAIAPFNADEAAAHQQAWADHLGVPVEYENSIGMRFRLIPPGEFLMGSTPEEIEAALQVAGDEDVWQERIPSEGPQHKVILTEPVYVGVTEVTQSEYEEVMGTNPSLFAASGEGREAVANLETGNHPVEQVSWNDAAEFFAKLSQQEQLKPFYLRTGEEVTPLEGTGYRLPTEAEWEFACRAGTATRFWCGDNDNDLTQAGWIDRNSAGRTHPVGELQANPFGLFDVHGNVWEWVQDNWDPPFYGQFTKDAAVDPYNSFSAGSQRVMRGGGWGRHPSYCRSSLRHFFHPGLLTDDVGFRAALPVDAVRERVSAGTPPPVVAADESLDPQRRVAEMVVAHGGSVGYAGSRSGGITSLDEIPETRFAVSHIHLHASSTLRDDDLATLSGIDSLEHLGVAGTAISDAGIAALGNLERLHSLDIGLTQVTDAGVELLTEATGLHTLQLNSSLITDAACRSLARIPSLRYLAIANTSITDAGVQQIANLPHVRFLKLSGSSQLTPACVSELKLLPTLQQLSLSNVACIDDDVLPQLAEFEHLLWLDVRGTRISHEGAPRLQALLPNCVVVHESLPPLPAEQAAAQWVLDQGGQIGAPTIPDTAFGLGYVNLGDTPPPRGTENLDGLRCLESFHWGRLENANEELAPIGDMPGIIGLSVSSSDVGPIGMEQIGRLRQLEQLFVTGCQNLTDDSLRALAGCPHLQRLSADRIPLTDVGLQHLAAVTSLMWLEIGGCPQITDAGLQHLTALPRLRRVNLSSTNITDAAIEHLSRMPSLQVLLVHDTQITPEGAARLQAALPRCVVFHESLDAIPWRRGTEPAADLITDESLDPQRRAAEMIVAHGGSVSYGSRGIASLDEIPETRFAIGVVNLAGSPTLSDADLELLSDIDSLEYLGVAGTAISDAGIAALGNLERLHGLDLGNTQVTDAGVELLTEATNLHTLHLNGSLISDAACGSLARMPSLRYLGIANTSITDAGIEQIANLPHVRFLYLGGNSQLTPACLSELKKLPTLQQLSLNGVACVDDDVVPQLAEFEHLLWLDVRGTRISYEGAPRLQALLPNCVVVHESLPPLSTEQAAAQWVLDQGGQIRVVFDGVTTVPDTAFGLRYVNLGDTPPPRGTENLVGLRCLESFHWNRLENADEELAPIGDMPGIIGLSVSSSDVGPIGMSHIGRLRQLEQLFVIGCQNLTDESLRALAGCPHLQRLDADRIPLTDVGLQHLAAVTSLMWLEIGGCPQITDAGLQHLTALPRLRRVNLSSTNITDAAIEHLSRMPSLQVLLLYGTQITPEGAARLQAALPRCVVFHESLDTTPWRRGEPVDPAAERAAAEWVLSVGGWVRVVELESGSMPDISAGEPLPEADFAIQAVNFHYSQQVSDDDLSRISHCARLEQISLAGLPITDVGLRHLVPIRTLIDLDLNGGLDRQRSDDMLAPLADMPQLQRLVLANNYALTDAALRHLAGLTQLATLDLSGIGEISDQGLAHLAGLHQLKTVAINSLQITDVGVTQLIVANPQLEVISIDNVDRVAQRTLLPLRDARQLRRVSLSGDQLTPEGVAALQQLPQLREVVVRNPVTDDSLSRLNELPALEGIEIWFWKAGQAPPHAGYAALAEHPTVRAIVIHGASGSPHDDGILALSAIPTLDGLNIAFNDQFEPRNYTTDWIPEFRRRRPDVSLNIDGEVYPAEIGDVSVDPAAERAAAEWVLSVGGSGTLVNLESGAEERYYTNRPLPDFDFALVEVVLTRCQAVTDDDLARISRCWKLRNLELRETPIDGSGLAHVRLLPALTHLDLTKVPNATDTSLAPLSELRQLTHLEFAANPHLTDSVLEHVAPLTHLESLSLHTSTQLGDVGLAFLHELRSLRSLTLGTYRITDQGVSQLVQQNPSLEWIAVENLNEKAHRTLRPLMHANELRSVFVSGDQLDEEGMNILSQLNRLETLGVNEPVTQEALSRLLELGHLRNIELRFFRRDSDLPRLNYLALCDHRAIESILFFNIQSGFGSPTDDELLALCNMESLRSLNLQFTQPADKTLPQRNYTTDWIPEFRHRRPDISLNIDGVEYPAEPAE